MNASNPFKVPTCFQQLEVQRRRDRFRKGVVAAVAAVATLLVILLVQGCMSEHAKTSSSATTPLNPVASQASNNLMAKRVAQPPAPMSTRPVLPVNAAVTTPVVKPAPVVAQPVPVNSDLVYVVKPGDTLSHIARLHQTTVKALKSVNGLQSDTIIVGDKLKLPAA